MTRHSPQTPEAAIFERFASGTINPDDPHEVVLCPKTPQHISSFLRVIDKLTANSKLYKIKFIQDIDDQKPCLVVQGPTGSEIEYTLGSFFDWLNSSTSPSNLLVQNVDSWIGSKMISRILKEILDQNNPRRYSIVMTSKVNLHDLDSSDFAIKDTHSRLLRLMPIPFTGLRATRPRNKPPRRSAPKPIG